MTAIKTEEERARLDELYSLVDAENAAAEAETEKPEPTKPTKVICRLEKAERAAREQDNHHYYKIFADSVRKLAAKLQGVADVEN